MFFLRKIKESGRTIDCYRLAAAAAPKASAWLMPPPVAVMHKSDEILRHSHRMRLCLHLFGGGKVRVCERCQALCDLLHFMSCMVLKGGTCIMRYNLIVGCLLSISILQEG